MTALGVYGLTAVTAVVAETPLEVARIHPVPVEVLDDQLAVLFKTYPIRSVKTGMIPSADHVATVVKHLTAWKRADPAAQLVVDPVLVASTEDALAIAGTQEYMEKQLLPLADLITPNLVEARRLLDEDPEPLKGDVTSMVRSLCQKFGSAVLLKGGHASDCQEDVTDILSTEAGELTAFTSERIPGGHQLHGTGCTLSAAIAAHLAQRMALEDAIEAAKAYVRGGMENALHWPGGVSALGGSAGSSKGAPQKPPIGNRIDESVAKG